MGSRSKTLIVSFLALVVVGILVVNVNNKQLFKGQLVQPEEVQTVQLPDLTANLNIIKPDTKQGDVKVEATIANSGEGEVKGTETFEYAISINGTEVLTNSDSYTALEAGDSFTFTYPIPREIYKYPNTGSIKFTVDTKNSIKESNENNNSVEKSYNF